MSGRQPLPGFVNPITPEAYQANKASLEAAQARIAALDAINEEGRKTHEELERALREKIREGELAKQMLDQLKDPTQPFSISGIPMTRQILPPPIANPNLINVASTSRVEDVRDHYRPYSSSSRQNPVVTSNGHPHPSQTSQLQKQVVQGNSSQLHHQRAIVQHQMQHNQTAFSVQNGSAGHDARATHQIQPHQRIPHPLQQQQWQPAGQIPPPQKTDPQVQIRGPAVPIASSSNSFPETSSLGGALGSFHSTQSNTQGVTNTKQSTLPSSLQSNDNMIPLRGTTSSHSNAQPVGLTLHLPEAPQSSSRPQEVVRSSETIPAVNGRNYSQPEHRPQRPGAEQIILYLKQVIAEWEKVAPPHSYFDLPYTSYRVYKNKASVVNIIVPDGKGGTSMVRPAYFSIDHLAQLASQPIQSNTTSTTQNPTFAPNPSSQIPTPATTFTNSIVSSTPSNPKTRPSQALPSPAQADKKHLARDILRALAPAKRPRDTEGPRAIDEPDAKRHAAGQSTMPTTKPSVIAIPEWNGNSISQQRSTSNTIHGATIKTTDPKYDNASSTEFTRFIPTVSVPTQPPTTIHLGPPPTPCSPKVPLAESNQIAHSASKSSSPMPAMLRASVEVDESSTAELSNDDIHLIGPSPTPPPLTPVVTSPPSSPATQKLPLFLPSPASTRYSDGGEDAGDDMKSASASVQALSQTSSVVSLDKGKRRLIDYVDVPPLPEYVLRYKAQLAKWKQKRSSPSETTSTRVLSRSASSFGEDTEFTLDSQGTFTIDPVEKNAVRLSCTRLREVECEWAGCNVVLNSVQGLLAHLNSTHKPPDRKPFMCLWKQCGRRCTFSEKHPSHLETHALLPLHCAYEDCEEFFRSPGRLVKHNLSEHQEDNLKPSASPFRPGFGSLPPTPPKLPSYMVEARIVKPASISQTRHADLGPWVLRHIAGPVFVTERTNAATPLKSPKASKKTRVEKMDSIYSFLAPELKMIQHSSRMSHGEGRLAFKDLDSYRVSELMNEGFVLWGTPEREQHSPQGTLPGSQHLNHELFRALSLEDTIKLEGDAGSWDVTPPPGEPTRREHSSDEDAVEDMLAYPNSL